jgi:pyruvate dehydrogenase E1 component alpha subunit/2-oxoisovalerate dehydrogenase E1 component alpha subunit
VANNQFAYSTPNDRQFACADLADKAAGYGVESHSVDGTDLTACLQTLETAVARARAGHGPQLVVAQLLRLCGHGEHDDAGYITPQLKNSALGRDCLKVAEDFLVATKMADAAQLAAWRSETIREIEEAVAPVQREPLPDSLAEKWHALATKHLNEIRADDFEI